MEIKTRPNDQKNIIIIIILKITNHNENKNANYDNSDDFDDPFKNKNHGNFFYSTKNAMYYVIFQIMNMCIHSIEEISFEKFIINQYLFCNDQENSFSNKIVLILLKKFLQRLLKY